MSINDKIKDLQTKGNEAFERGDYDEAQTYFKNLVIINPKFADVLNKLGFIASMKGNPHEAVEYLQRAVALNPTYTEAALNLSITLNELGETERAAGVMANLANSTHVQQGELDPYVAGKLANEHFKLGNMYLDFGHHDSAIAEYQKAIELKAGLADVHTKLGMAFREEGLWDEAIAEFTTAIEGNKHFGSAWVQLGLTYHMQGQTELAVETWEKALEINPDINEAKSFLSIFSSEA